MVYAKLPVISFRARENPRQNFRSCLYMYYKLSFLVVVERLDVGNQIEYS